ncbi:hypothetical protein CHH28_17250 [Bacterioplanes sanyensis]|uniref:Uncharacterized protein n=1 Tax=Bacterioplanes sanyensis TaxID=1249553 RepID=A0A222FP53_9GAMM|nr:hypothetical protein [Bacterioplanes sanyensis]ASP40316.1 hypothetical protein CHH28_17250 [Bacterioplanes sanyensis]
MNKDQAYHQIALACLKTLRETTAGEADDRISGLYDAIDEAFQSQLGLLAEELELYRQRLQQIRELDPKQHSLADAQAIATPNNTAH